MPPSSFFPRALGGALRAPHGAHAPGAGRRPAAWAHGSADLYGGAAHHVRMAGLDPCVRGAQRRSWVHGAQPQVIAGSLEVDRRPERSVVGALVTGAIHGDVRGPRSQVLE